MLVKDCMGREMDASRFWLEIDRDEAGCVWYYVCCEVRRTYGCVERCVLFAKDSQDEAFALLDEFRAGLKEELFDLFIDALLGEL